MATHALVKTLDIIVYHSDSAPDELDDTLEHIRPISSAGTARFKHLASTADHEAVLPGQDQTTKYALVGSQSAQRCFYLGRWGRVAGREGSYRRHGALAVDGVWC